MPYNFRRRVLFGLGLKILCEEIKITFNLEQKKTEKPKNNIEMFECFFKTYLSLHMFSRIHSAELPINDD